VEKKIDMKRLATFQILEVGLGAVNRHRTASNNQEKVVAEIDDRYLYVSIVGLHGDQADENGNPKGNDNGDYFLWEDLLSVKKDGPFRGKLTFQTWNDKPVHLNHDENYSWGFIHSTFPIAEEKAIYMLLALDKKKEPELCRKIETGEVTAVSMGCTIQWSLCGICNHRSNSDDEWCEHLKHYKGKHLPSTAEWVYEICKDIEGCEMSFIVTKQNGSWFNDIQADKGAEAKSIVANSKENKGMDNITRDSAFSEGEKNASANFTEDAFQVNMSNGGNGGGDKSAMLNRQIAATVAEISGNGNSSIQLPNTTQQAEYKSAIKAHVAIEEGELVSSDILKVAQKLGLIEDIDDCTVKSAKLIIASKAQESFGGVPREEKVVEAKKSPFKLKTEAKSDTKIKCQRCNSKMVGNPNYCTVCGQRIRRKKAEQLINEGPETKGQQVPKQTIEKQKKIIEKGTDEQGQEVPQKKPEKPEVLLSATPETVNDPKRQHSDFKEVSTQKMAQMYHSQDRPEYVAEKQDNGVDEMPDEDVVVVPVETDGDIAEAVVDGVTEDVEGTPIEEKIEEAIEEVEETKELLKSIGQEVAEMLGTVEADNMEEYGETFIDSDVYQNGLEGNSDNQMVDDFYNWAEVENEDDEEVKNILMTAKKKTMHYAKMKKMAQLASPPPTTTTVPGEKVVVPNNEINTDDDVEEGVVVESDPTSATVKVQTPTGETQDVDKTEVKTMAKYTAEWINVKNGDNQNKEKSGYMVLENGKAVVAINLLSAFADDEKGKRVASVETINNWEWFKSADYHKMLEDTLNEVGLEQTLDQYTNVIRIAQEGDIERDILPETNQEIGNLPEEPGEPEEDKIIDDETSEELLTNDVDKSPEIFDALSDTFATLVVTSDLFDVDIVIEQIRDISSDEAKLAEFKGKLEEKISSKENEIGIEEESVEEVIEEEPQEAIEEAPEDDRKLEERREAKVKLIKSINNLETKIQALQNKFVEEKGKNIKLKKKLASADKTVKAYEDRKVTMIKKPKVKKLAKMMTYVGMECNETELMKLDNDALAAKQVDVAKVYAKFQAVEKKTKKVAKKSGLSEADKKGLIGGGVPKGVDTTLDDGKKTQTGFKFSSKKDCNK